MRHLIPVASESHYLNAGTIVNSLAQRSTGHKTTDIVLKHYFRSGREDFRNALQSAVPRLLPHGRAGLLTEPPVECGVERNPGKSWGGD